MIRSIQYNSELTSMRWFGYFDLLGISDLIKSGDNIDIFIPLSSTINEIHLLGKGWDDIEYAWFSDTFIIYAKDDSYSSFNSICWISSWFVYVLISYNIPIKGAISCDEFYADKKNTLFFGKALLEAYEYGEAQNWIGLLLCPSTVERLNTLKKADHQFFKKYQIPLKKPQRFSLNSCQLVL